VLLDLADEDAAGRALDRDRAVDPGQLVGEDGIDDDALDLVDATGVVGLGLGVLRGAVAASIRWWLLVSSRGR